MGDFWSKTQGVHYNSFADGDQLGRGGLAFTGVKVSDGAWLWNHCANGHDNMGGYQAKNPTVNLNLFWVQCKAKENPVIRLSSDQWTRDPTCKATEQHTDVGSKHYRRSLKEN